ncbi:hypothetical protein EMWEY_00052010 [Eimeria maxima]|uniref:Uncharacterized protein n=1 Tax=Eimeria maxima TaxID=5804 RepID=U6LX49_EIMMA|nr:hypothetical protein EMWEY_00052010 [Eimeria maxima]CDJ56311.1 hypothetical protein EMWEY_00052010 [Eimeria maxima]
MVGSAFLSLTIKAKHCNEISLFAYLEDVDINNGFSHYVTEAQASAGFEPSFRNSRRFACWKLRAGSANIL